jgi:hypothetical protein
MSEQTERALELRGYALWRLVETIADGQRWECIVPDVRVIAERLARVQAVLETYGCHDPGCPASRRVGATCTCGLAALLTPEPQPSEADR